MSDLGDFSIKVEGKDEEGKVILLVADEKFGDYTLAIKLGDMDDDGNIQVDYDFASKVDVPKERTEEILSSFINHIISEHLKDLAIEQKINEE